MQVQKAWIHSKPVVSLDWLDACKARSLFVETSPHAFANPSSSGTRSTSCVRTSATSTQESASGTDKDENRDNPYPLPYLAKGPGGFKRTATSLSSGGSSKRHQANPPHKCAAKPVKIPVPIANKAPEGCPETTPRGAADPAAQLEGGILLPGWECLLTIPASATGDQSNYAMQLIVQDLGQGAGLERSYVFVRWGFSEQRGSMCRLNGPYDTIGEAQGFFRRRFKDKTGVDWGSGAGAQPGASSKAHPHRIVFVPMPAAEASVSQLETKGLVKMILDRSVVEDIAL